MPSDGVALMQGDGRESMRREAPWEREGRMS